MVEALVQAQGYLYFFITVALTILLYWYAYHLWTSKKKGNVDYERYSNLVLDDAINDTPVESEASVQSAQHKTQP